VLPGPDLAHDWITRPVAEPLPAGAPRSLHQESFVVCTGGVLRTVRTESGAIAVQIVHAPAGSARDIEPPDSAPDEQAVDKDGQTYLHAPGAYKIRPPFLELHRRQRSCMLLTEVAPPLITGMMWSYSRCAPGPSAPYSTHRPPSRAHTAF
jgi:hypothetical protein